MFLKGVLMKKYSAVCMPMFALAVAMVFALNLVACSAAENDKKPAEQKAETSKAEAPKTPAPTADAKPAADGKDDFIVQVNGEKLTTAEVDAMLDGQMASISKQVPPEQMEQVKAQLEQMKGKWRQQLSDYFIQKTVLAQEADKKKIVVTDDEVNAQLKEYEQQIPPGTKLEDVLKQQGVSIEKLKADIKNILKAKKLMDSQITAGPASTDEEIKNYYDVNKSKFDEPEKVHARHILVKANATDNETVKKAKKAKIETIRKKLVAKGDFAKIAQENSDCPSKAKGGDLGTFSKGQMVKPFEDAAFGQKVNEIGPVVETQFGYHVIQTQEHMPAKTKTLDQVKPDIIKSLQEQNKQKAIKDYIDGLTKQATIVYGKN
jgi:peptidyl-prolyl cis-trans isomerase C